MNSSDKTKKTIKPFFVFMSKMWHWHCMVTTQQWNTLISSTQSGVGGKWKRLLYFVHFIKMNNSSTVNFHIWSSNKQTNALELQINSRDEGFRFVPLAGRNTVILFLMCVFKAEIMYFSFALCACRPSTQWAGITKASSSCAATRTAAWPCGTSETPPSPSRSPFHMVRA